MNLALITQDFPPEVGGIQTYAFELARRFTKQCRNFFVIAPYKEQSAQVDHKLSYPVYRIRCENHFLGLKSMLSAPALLAKNNIRQVFHTQWQTLPASVFARRLGVVDRIYVAVHARELLFNPFEGVPVLQQGYEWYKRKMLAHVDLFFPVSNFMADLLQQYGVMENRIQVVNNGTDPEKFYPLDTGEARKSIGIGADKQKILLSTARLVSRKGIDTTLKAFKRVLKNHPDSCYLIVGDGPERTKLQKLAEELNISEAVKFTGLIPHEQLIEFYNACDVFVMPSKTERPNIEGFGIVYLEANACRKPVIGTFSGGIPSAIVNGETGLLVQERDPDALAEAIEYLFSNSDLASRMGEQGRRRVVDSANWDQVAQKLLMAMQGTI